MFCINCFHFETRVVNSRGHKKQPSVWRRRRCEACQSVFSTNEQPSLGSRQVLDSGGSKTHFNIGRLTISIAKAFTHDTSIGKLHAYDLAQTVERQLATDYPALSTDDISAVTHHTLKRFDELAAVQYAAAHQLIVAVRRRGRPSIASPERAKRPSPSQ